MPGEHGAWGGLPEYLQRMAWVNEIFDDDVKTEGWLRYPNENGARLVTTQPWYKVSPKRPEPAAAEIDAYMWRKGVLKCYDGAWIHARRDIAASDALPKNFVVDVAGHVQPFDVILLAPDHARTDHLRNMPRNLPQADVDNVSACGSER